ncbi:hypothetical protein C8Q76DRAFT_179902 [Earliella scabrosa]|nr:hypothetical protein C8Q76DRAFT_179902 [Earliella scabrosa]
MASATYAAQHPFFSHLTALLSIYHDTKHPSASGTPLAAPPNLPQYDGPTDPQIEQIQHSLETIVRRMHAAEHALDSIREQQRADSQTQVPTSQRLERDTEDSGDVPASSPDASDWKSTAPSYAGTVRILPPKMRSDRDADDTASGALAAPDVTTVLAHDTSTDRELADLRSQVKDVARVCEALARGDLTTRKIEFDTSDSEGEMHTIKTTLNALLEMWRLLVPEISRVALEVGTQGVFGGQVHAKDVQGRGAWADLTQGVNTMAANLTTQVRSVALVVGAVASGDASQTVTVEAHGEMLAMKTSVNETVRRLSALRNEVVDRLAFPMVGPVGEHANVADRQQDAWTETTSAVHHMAGTFKNMIRAVAAVMVALTLGDTTQRITLDVCGEMLDLKVTVNAAVEHLHLVAREVIRVADELGTDGVFGGQAEVDDVDGIWRELVHRVNAMARTLTLQVRALGRTTSAIAQGDFTQKIRDVPATGEMLEIFNTVNGLADMLQLFSAEVVRVNHETGTTGQLGAQAEVGHVYGTWQELTMSVNRMSSNLTVQIRSLLQMISSMLDADGDGPFTEDLERYRHGSREIDSLWMCIVELGREVCALRKKVGGALAQGSK